MKKFRKLLISLLAIALVISAGSVVAFAADDGPAISDSDIQRLVELYKKGVFTAEDFESDSNIRSDSDIVDGSGVVAGLESIGDNTVVKLSGADTDNKDVTITARPETAIDGFVFSMRVAADGGVFNIYASGVSASGDKFSNTQLVSLDFSENGGVSVQKFGLYEMPVLEVLPDVALVKGAWYSLTFIYNASSATYKLELVQTTDADGATLDESVVYTTELPGALKSIDGAKVAVSGTSVAGKTIYLDDIYFYEGTELVDYAASEAQLGAAVISLTEKLDSAAANKKAGIVEKLQLFVQERAFEASAYAKEVKFAKLKLAEYYTNVYKSVVDSYNAGDTYLERVARIAEMELAYENIPEIPVYTAQEDAEACEIMVNVSDTLAATVTVYDAIAFDLEYVAGQSVAFIDYMAAVQTTSNRYEKLEIWTKEASEFDFDPTFYAEIVKDGKKVLYDMTVPYQSYVNMVRKYNSIAADCEKFIASVNIVKDLSADFIDRYNAYKTAISVRFLDVEYTYYYFETVSYALTRVAEDGADATLGTIAGEYIATNVYGDKFTVIITDSETEKTISFTTAHGEEIVWNYEITDDGIKLYDGEVEITDPALGSVILSDDGAVTELYCNTKVHPLRDVVDEDDNVTHAGYITLFSELRVEIEEIEKNCVGFIAAVADAKASTNVSSFDLCIAKAERYDILGNDSTKIALELSYPGVLEAIADYNYLYDKRINDEIKAQKFVDAVELVKAAKDKAEIKAAMANAANYLPENILDGFDGYSEAISYYSDLEATMLYNESNAKNFIALVNSLSGASTYKEKYDIIKAAKGIKLHTIYRLLPKEVKA